MSRISIILLMLIFVWMIQLCLSYIQIKKFNQRIFALRKLGKKTAVGVAGNVYKRRTYAILVTDGRNKIIAAERFSGWTVFAHPKPVSHLVGMQARDISSTAAPPAGIGKKLWAAFQNAAGYITGERSAADPGHGGRRRGIFPQLTGWRTTASKDNETTGKTGGDGRALK